MKTIKIYKWSLELKDDTKDYDDGNVYTHVVCRISSEDDGITEVSEKSVKIDKKLQSWDEIKPELTTKLLAAGLVSSSDVDNYLDSGIN